MSAMTGHCGWAGAWRTDEWESSQTLTWQLNLKETVWDGKGVSGVERDETSLGRASW